MKLTLWNEEYVPNLTELRNPIQFRLGEFASLKRDLWFREILLCLLTPQSKPQHAEWALSQMEERGLFDGKCEERHVEEILRDGSHYVRFHRVKAKRIKKFLLQRPLIEEILDRRLSPYEEREKLVPLVDGFGWKEGSHALRNIGRPGLAILDRHILRCLLDLGAIDSIPKSLTERRYKEYERKFQQLADALGEQMDALDLLFWARHTGFIYK